MHMSQAAQSVVLVLQHGTKLSTVAHCAQPTVALQAGDKVLQVSASFGADVWDAKNYGQVMYAIKTRNGEVYMRMLRRGGDMSILEVSRRPNFTKNLTAGLCTSGWWGCQGRLVHLGIL